MEILALFFDRGFLLHFLGVYCCFFFSLGVLGICTLTLLDIGLPVLLLEMRIEAPNGLFRFRFGS
jgi:hypothetical protein